jgi:TPR repeat protein
LNMVVAIWVTIGYLWAVPEEPKLEERRQELLEKALNGEVSAMLHLGGQFQLEGDLTLAERWFRKAADKGDVGAIWSLVGIFERRPLNVRAEIMKSLYEELITLGQPQGYYRLGRLYSWEDSPLRDESLGDMYLRDAVGLGVTEAKLLLGRLFLGEWGHQRDALQAVDYFTQASKDKNPEAFRYLGMIYRYGLGNRTDLDLAWRNYGQAARLGDVESLVIIAEALYEGRDIEKDPPRAEQYFRRAAMLGHRDAEQRLEQLFPKL